LLEFYKHKIDLYLEKEKNDLATGFISKMRIDNVFEPIKYYFIPDKRTKIKYKNYYMIDDLMTPYNTIKNIENIKEATVTG
jgi:hypothetical protein